MPEPRTAPAVSTGHTGKRTRWLLGGLVFLVHSLSPIPQSGDSRLSAATGWAFLHHLDLDLGRYPGIASLADQGDLVRSNGHLLPFFPWPPMLLSIPADLVVWAFSKGSGLPGDFLPGHTFFVEVPTASLIVALTTVAIRELLLGLPRRPGLEAGAVSGRVAMLAALLFAFGSSAWSVGSRALWQQTVSMLLITLTLVALQRVGRSGRAPVVLGSLVALAVVVRPTNAVFAVLVLVLIGWRHRPAALRFVVGGLLVTVVFLAYSRWQYGQFLPPYYEPSRFGDPPRYGFGESLLVNLVSPSRGLLLFDPLIVLAVISVARAVRRRVVGATDVLMCAAVIGQLLVIAKYGSTGGFTYGPRLMIDILPMLVVLAAPMLAVFDRPVGATGAGAGAGVAGAGVAGATGAGVVGTAGVPGAGSLRGAPSVSGIRHRVGAAAVALLIAWSVLVNAAGAVSRAGVCWNSDPVSVDVQPGRVWDLADAQFLRPVRAVLSGEGLHDVVLGYCTADRGA